MVAFFTPLFIEKVNINNICNYFRVRAKFTEFCVLLFLYNDILIQKHKKYHNLCYNTLLIGLLNFGKCSKIK